MIPTSGDPGAIDDGTLDLLVDGELSEAERRELLASLDHMPDGWRRCALAFLEAQRWRKELSAVARQSAAPAGEGRPARPVAVRRGFPGGVWGTLLAMAGSFVLALAGGWVASGLLRTPGMPSGGPALEEVAAVPATPQGPAPPTAEPPSSWQLVSVPVEGGPAGAPKTVQLPAMERQSLDPHWLERSPPPIPPDILDFLRRSGHEVRQSRQLVPFPLKDGRQMVFPVDQVDVHYVGNPAYQ